jgi:hypothetical protein
MPDFMGDDVAQHLDGHIVVVLQHTVIKDMDGDSRRAIRHGVGHRFRPKVGRGGAIHLNVDDIIGGIHAPPAWEPLGPNVCVGEHGVDHRLRASHDEVVDQSPMLDADKNRTIFRRVCAGGGHNHSGTTEQKEFHFPLPTRERKNSKEPAMPDEAF